MLCKLKRFFSPSCALLTILKILLGMMRRKVRGKWCRSVLSSSTVRLVELLRSKHATHLAARTIRKYVQSSYVGRQGGEGEKEACFRKIRKAFQNLHSCCTSGSTTEAHTLAACACSGRGFFLLKRLAGKTSCLIITLPHRCAGLQRDWSFVLG